MSGESSKFSRQDAHTAEWVLGLIFACLAAGIAATGYFYYQNYEKSYRAAIERQLTAIAELKVSELVQWRHERLGDGSILFQNAPLTALVRRLLEKPEDMDSKQQLQVWFGKYQADNRYDEIRLLDAQGVSRLSLPAGLPAVSTSVARNVSEGTRLGRVTLQDLYRSERDQQVRMGVMVPVFDEQNPNRLLATFFLRIDPATYLYPMIQRWPTPSSTAETLLVRREGNEVVFLNELRFQKNTALTLRESLDRTLLPAAQAALGKEGIIEGTDYRGVPVVAALRAIPDSPWFLVARMDAAEVYAPLREQLRFVVIVIGALLFGAGAGITLFWRQQSVRFYRERAAATETIRETNEYLENLFNYANAPIIVWDLQFKISRFNHAFESLTGRKVGEVIGQSLDILFPPALVDSSMALIRKTTGGERWKTVEISILHRDGSFRTVLWSSAAVFLADGKTSVATIAQGQDITERKQAEAALRESEKRFRSLAVATSQIIWYTDAQGQVCGPMPSFQAYTGQSDEEISGSGWAATLHPDDAERTIKVWQEAVAAKTGYLTEYRLRRHDGVYRYFTARGAPVMTDDGSILEWIGTCSDITERKQAEEMLRESEAKFRTLIENIPQKILMKDRNCKWVMISENLARDFGFRPEDVVGKIDSQLFTPELAAKYHADDVRIMETGRTEELEEKYLVGGRETWVNTIKTPVRSESGSIVGVLGIFWDITERKRAEGALRESESRFRQLAESLPQLVWTCQPDGPCDYLNRQWVEFTGVPEAQQHGFGWLAQLHPDDRAPAVAAWEAAVASCSDFRVEFRIRRHDGEYRWFDTQAIRLHDATGHTVKWFGSNTDITERKRAEEEIRELNTGLEQRVRDRTTALEASNKELEAFSYSVSHDLRAPLRAMDGFSMALLEDSAGKLDETAQGYLRRIRAGSQRMAQLIDDLLNLSRVTRAKMLRESVDLTAMAEEIGAEFQKSQPERQVGLVVAPDLAVRADRPMLRVVLNNLLGNAWKFTGRCAQARIEVGAQERDGQRIFFVRDNGAGFDMTYVDKLFGAFQRLHSTQELEGTGIGLALVQRIIHRHGGRAWAEGTVGHGATVYFTLEEKGRN